MLWSVSRQARTAWHQATDGSPAPYRFILRVALPLVVAGTTWTALRPTINAALGTLPDPERAQAGFGVVLPFVLATCSPLWIMHNVTLVLPRSVRDVRIVARFAAGTSLFFALLVLLVTWTGLRHWLLGEVFGLNDALAADVTPAIRIVAVEPFLLAGRGFAQGILMHARRTEVMLYAAPVKLVVVGALGLSVAHHSPEVNGALLGTALFLAADLVDAGVFLYTARRLLRAGRVFERVAMPAAPEAVPLSGRDPESQRV
ncbi:MAG: hypothetical protein R3E12_01235 [Candidatus Eisenbacteria bacterium]